MNKKSLRKIRVGQWVRIKWDDVGATDMIVTDKTNSHGRLSFRGITPFDSVDGSESFEGEQVMAVGDMVSAKYSGLPS